MGDKLNERNRARRKFMRSAGTLGLAGFFGGQAVSGFAEDRKRKPENHTEIEYESSADGAAGTASGGTGTGLTASSNGVVGTTTLPFENGQRELVQYPGKRPMIRLTTEALQLETPFQVFNEGAITANDAFFVRYHNSGQPTSIDGDAFRVQISGNVTTPLSLSVADLQTKFPAMELVAALQCSGNSRGFSNPRVRGGQYGNGAMGNAKYKGVSLKKVLEAAGVKAGSVQVAFGGLDNPKEDPPDFMKALNLDVALNGDVMLAYSQNGEDIPFLNGYPLKLIVPGWYATYWVKHVNEIVVMTSNLKQFYMDTAYRIPTTPDACIPPGTKPSATVPINRLNVRSFITSHMEGAKVMTNQPITVKGIAFDGGTGIKQVLFSYDGGASWSAASLGTDLGKYSFREWTIPFTPRQTGKYALKVRAINNAGDTQPLAACWNPSGYMRNVVETVNVSAV